MKVGSGSTSETLKCIVCKKVTNSYDAITNVGLELKVPICREHFGSINTDKSIGKLMSAIKVILVNPILTMEESK